MPRNTLSIKWCHTSARCESVRRANISSICSSCAPALQGISNLCQHSHAVHQSDLQYNNMSFWLAYFICISDISDISRLCDRPSLTLYTLYIMLMMVCHRAERYQSALHSTRMISAKILNYTTKDTTPGKIHHHTRKSPQQILYHTRCNIHSGLNQGTMHWYILLVLVKTLDWHFWISTARCTLGHLEFQSPHRWMICWIRRSWD